MAEARSSEAPRVPRGKWVMQLHRKPTRSDVLFHRLAESLARRYWYTQVHFRQEILRLETDEIWDAAMQMSRAVARDNTLAAMRGEPSLFTLPAGLDTLAQAATRTALAAVINYLEIAHNCLLKRNHPDIELLAPRLTETFRRFFIDKLSPAGELRPCLENPIGDDERYFPPADLPADPATSSGNPATDAFRLNVLVADGDDARAVMRKLIAFAKTDPFLAPEFTVEIVTKLTARQMHAAKVKRKFDEVAEAIHIRDRFLFSPCRQGGKLPVQIFLDQQLLASEQQKERLKRWARLNTDGVFRLESSTAEAALLRELSSGRELTVVRDAMLASLSSGTLIRARVIPWDDQWMISGTAQVIDPASANQDAFKEMLHPLRVRRTADEDDPRLLSARGHVKTVHAQFVERFGGELATFKTLAECREALGQFHHQLTIELRLPDGRQFADAWQHDTGLDFPPFIQEQFANGETTVTSPGVVYDAVHGMGFMPSAEEVSFAMTSPFPTVEQKQAFARLLLEKWRPGWLIERLAGDYPERVESIIRELLGESDFALARDLEPLLGRLKCPDHTLPSRPVPFLVA